MWVVRVGENAITALPKERQFFFDNLLVRIHLIIEMILVDRLAPWEFEFPFPGSLISTVLKRKRNIQVAVVLLHRRPPGNRAHLKPEGKEAGSLF